MPANILAGHDYRSIAAKLQAMHQELTDCTIGITQTPAPPFAEGERAQLVARLYTECGAQTHLDDCGNVIAVYRAPDPGEQTLLVTAHIDTVFPAGTPVQVRREDGRLHAPGIGDNSASVAILAALIKAMRAEHYQPPCGLVFVANVGEEGLGDLRGMKYLFDSGFVDAWRVGAVIAFDGKIGFVCSQGVTRRRLEMGFTGPGGHSWNDFGIPSAVHAAGRAIANIDAIKVPVNPRTTYTVGMVNGGVSVNSIAGYARILIDMRSEDADALARLEEQVRSAGRAAVAGYNKLSTAVTVVGDRPGGWLPSDHPLVASAITLLNLKGLAVRWITASTDANVPLSRGVPAVTVGLVKYDRAHTTEECLEEASLVPGACHALAVLLSGLIYCCR